MISPHQISPLLLRNRIPKRREVIRKQHIRTLLIKPQQLLLPQREDAPQYQPQAPLRVFLRICQCKSRTP